MEKCYGVVWREGSHPLATGMLELGPRGLRFEGLVDSEPAMQTIPYEDLAGVRVGRSQGERLDGRPTVIVERRGGLPVTLTTVAQPSLVGEIVERLASLQLAGETQRRVVVVVPIMADAHDAVRTLLDAGPPFDPSDLPGLERHEHRRGRRVLPHDRRGCVPVRLELRRSRDRADALRAGPLEGRRGVARVSRRAASNRRRGVLVAAGRRQSAARSRNRVSTASTAITASLARHHSHTASMIASCTYTR